MPKDAFISVETKGNFYALCSDACRLVSVGLLAEIFHFFFFR